MKKVVLLVIITVAIVYFVYDHNIKSVSSTISKKEKYPVVQKRKEPSVTSTWSNNLNIFSNHTKNVQRVEKDTNHLQDNVVKNEIPYKYIGKMTYDNTQYVFLEYNDQTIVAKKGKVLPGNYRYDYLDKNKIMFTDMGNQSKHEIIVGAEP